MGNEEVSRIENEIIELEKTKKQIQDKINQLKGQQSKIMNDSGNVVPKTARMRTIKGAIEYLKEVDKDTAVTYYQIRNMVLQGILPHVMAGNRYLVNLSTLEEYLTPKKEE